MPKQAIIDYTRRLLRDIGIPSYILKEPFLWNGQLDAGLRDSILLEDPKFGERFSELAKQVCMDGIISCISDEYHCEYLCIRLPSESVRSILFIGPFTYEKLTVSRIIELCNYAALPGNLTKFMQQYYQSLPYVSDDRWMKGLARNLAEDLWPDCKNIKINTYIESQYVNPKYNTVHPVPTTNTIEQIVDRYQTERTLMNTISTGDVDKINSIISEEAIPKMKQRFPDSMRDQKNGLIVLNTLCRKAAETGGVHPVYLNEISGKYAFEIETCSNLQQLNKIWKNMLRKYCLLVQSHSLSGYSLPIQKAISHISFNLTGDLSLSAIAEMLSLNSSYLSTLFKKETGMTLTYYANKKRVEHAIFLLNTTDLPIQDIAALCGIPDLNYFTKTFKKYQNMTPSEYKEMLKGH
ncbi:MAG: AraC family transcriptional regulator [Hespellia sp.]|nr:AraC family transcriptional regulator [Hespellia sp.]